MEILDQCVRKRAGGELAELFATIGRERNESLAEFVYRRCGEDLRAARHPLAMGHNDALPPTLATLGRGYLERRYIRAVCKFLPRAFREQNVSLAGVGEAHAWLYDFESLSRLVQHAGFKEIKRMRFNSTRESDFPIVPLDATLKGEPRKGEQSMYLEAVAA